MMLTLQKRRSLHLGILFFLIWTVLAAPWLTEGAQAAPAQQEPRHSDPFWQATYWNNKGLEGAPVLQRNEGEINYDWGNGSPDSAVNADGFSARWTRYLHLEAGTYRFTAISDDGVRVYVNDERIINGWSDHGTQTFRTERQLPEGHHLVRVEFYENRGVAVMRFGWERISDGGTPSIQNWRGEYFNNRDLSGAPALVRDDERIDFNWGGGSPASGTVNADNFSARWTRNLDFGAGAYRFRVTVDDGTRLWVNNHLLIDAWRTQGPTTYTGELYLPGGAVPVRLEYFEDQGGAEVHLAWERADQPPPGPISNWRGEYFNNTNLSGSPVLVRDDSKIDFAWGSGSPAPGTVSADNFSVRWTRTVDFAAGTYRFRVRVDDGARLWVNNQLLIDAWREQATTSYSADISLSGSVALRLEYFEKIGAANIRLSWERTDQPTPSVNWRAEYFNNRDLSGAPVLTREDATIDFNWGNGSPAPGVVNADNFSVRWTQFIRFDGGRYRFTTETDDGVRLYIGDQQVINEWRVMGRTKFSFEINLSEGRHTIRMEYFEKGLEAFAKLSWQKLQEETAPRGNLITCVPPQPQNYAWVKLYRLDGNNKWYSIGRGIGSIHANGYLKIDGLPIDTGRFGNAGEPYRVEQWIGGHVARSTGNYQAGEPEFRLRPFTDNYTPWQCN